MPPTTRVTRADLDELLEDDEPLELGYGALNSEAGHANARYRDPKGGEACSWWVGMNSTTKALVVLSSILLAVVFGIAIWRRPSDTALPGVCTYKGYRLPTVGGAPLVTPSLYTVYWKPQFSAPGNSPLAYTGRSSVQVQIAADTDCILVHADENLHFSKVTVGGSAAASFQHDAANQRLVIRPKLGELLKKGGTTLEFEYDSPLQTNNVGLYLSTYKDDGGRVVNVTATQFEATSARTAMPCFDEPALKANFSVTVDGVPAGYTALGNMPVLGAAVHNADGTSKVTFQTTPRMSTYLVALVVGPLISAPVTARLQGRDMAVTAYGMDRSSVRGNIEFAAQVGASVTAFYEKTFGVPFPLPKQDMIAIPDFAAGAMENWGLVTYRETALLGSLNSSSASELSRISIVVAHELAHQWFGDIVTMDWWEALWLNEGFASRMEYIGSEHANPEFEVGRTFQSVSLFLALRADALADVQQLTSPHVDSSSAIEAMFSSISYDKGGSLLRMIDTWITSIGLGAPVGVDPTPENSKYYLGIQAYLKHNQYGSGKPADLWSALTSSTGVDPLQGWLTTYETRPGFALVTVDWTAGGSETTSGTLSLKQARFFQAPTSQNLTAAADQSINYWIPLSAKCSANCSAAASAPLARMLDCSHTSTSCAFTQPQWVEENGTPITIPFSIASDGWLKLNNDGTAYYRVSYPKALWTALFDQATVDAKLDNVTRKACTVNGAKCLSYGDTAQLTDDLFAIVEAAVPAEIEKRVDTRFAVEQVYKLGVANETSYEFVQPLLYHLGYLFGLIVPDIDFGSAGNEMDHLSHDQLACQASFLATGATESAAFSPGDLVGAVLNNLLLRLYGNASNPFAHPTTTNKKVGPLDLQLQVALLSAASQYNVSAVVSGADRLYGSWGTVHPDFQAVVISSKLRWSTSYGQEDSSEPDTTVFDELVAVYNSAFSAGTSNVSRILGVLASSYNRVLLQATLDFALSDAVRVGDKTGLITRVAANPFGRDLAYAFIRTNWPYLMSKFGQGGFDLSNLVSSLGSHFSSRPYFDAVTLFFAQNSAAVAGTMHAVNQGKEAILARAHWIERKEREHFCLWLAL